MFAGFNLKLSDDDLPQLYHADHEENCLIKGELYTYSNCIASSLENLLLQRETIFSSEIEENWFPAIHADVFISHSHDDKDLANALAEYLGSQYGITSFIDSMVWGYANDLITEMNDRYSLTTKGSYDYDKVLNASSHVHMLLNGALMKMMDGTECLLFLNTPNAISFVDSSDNDYTKSPWLYSELLATRLLRKRPLIDYRQEYLQAFSHDERSAELSLLYDARTDHLTDLNFSDLKLLSQNDFKSPYEALDKLYSDKDLFKNCGNNEYYGSEQ